MDLKIYIDRLKDGHIEKFKSVLPADFLDVQDEELSFPEPVSLIGEAYLASDHLVIRLHIETKAKIPCSICNSAVDVPIVVPDFYHTEPIAEIKSSLFDLSEIIREDILIQLPQFAECNQGKCPERTALKNFLKNTPEKSAKTSSGHFQFPFADLENE